jgi:hypothetical protein
MGCHQIKKLLHSKTINKVKRQPAEWEKNICQHSFDKGLLSKINKQFTKLSNKKM